MDFQTNEDAAAAPLAGARSDKPSVLLLIVGTEGYGMRRVWQALIRGLAARGWTVEIAVLMADKADLWKDLAPGIATFSPPLAVAIENLKGGGLGKAMSMLKRATLQLKLSRWLLSVVRARKTRLIILQTPAETVMAALVARLSGARAFWMMPNTVSGNYPLDLNRRIYRFLFRRCNLTPLPNSHYTAGTLGEGTFERPVVHLGVDPDYFAPDAGETLSRAELGLAGDAIVLGLFARLIPEKGHGVLVEALSRLPEPITVLVLGGPLEGDFPASLRRRIAELGLEDRILFLGPREDVRPYCRLCDVVLNTRLDPEPFGISVLEGMAMGKPVLAHGLGGPRETVVDGKTGWLIDQPTPESFAAGLARMLADRPRWPAMGEAARQHVCENFSEAAMLDRLEGHLLAAAAGK
ncbi:glycosyltransferase family 4 protein [Ancylobacter sp. G4_0304]|uniref:glycosyltransferase family 4 protein n=1 Tax=Ancylobacter sp. G4_0304 TaxID=3114289 RepID=UPI0039C72554